MATVETSGRDQSEVELSPLQSAMLESAMALEAEKYDALLHDVVAPTGKLDQIQLSAIRLAGRIAAETKKEGYLEALRSNPANIIGEALRAQDPDKNGNISDALSALDRNVYYATHYINCGKNMDRAAASLVNDSSFYAEEYIKHVTFDFGNIHLTRVDQFSDELSSEQRSWKFFTILQDMGGVPSPDIKDFQALKHVVKFRHNLGASYYGLDRSSEESGWYTTIHGLTSNRPGLRGVGFSVRLNPDDTPVALTIRGMPETVARMADKGHYIPYKPRVQK